MQRRRAKLMRPVRTVQLIARVERTVDHAVATQRTPNARTVLAAEHVTTARPIVGLLQIADVHFGVFYVCHFACFTHIVSNSMTMGMNAYRQRMISILTAVNLIGSIGALRNTVAVRRVRHTLAIAALELALAAARPTVVLVR